MIQCKRKLENKNQIANGKRRTQRFSAGQRKMKSIKDPMVVERYELIKGALTGCRSLLNVGCGSNVVRQFGVPHNAGIELHQPTFDRAVAAKTHDELIHGDVRMIDKCFPAKSFDACLCVDVIEHLTKAEGNQLVTDMEQIARKVVVIICPVGWLFQHHVEEGDLQTHQSAWSPTDLRMRDYAIQGLLGWSRLRGEYHMLKYRPKILWGLISLSTQQWTRWHPEYATSMFAVKRLA